MVFGKEEKGGGEGCVSSLVRTPREHLEGEQRKKGGGNPHMDLKWETLAP